MKSIHRPSIFFDNLVQILFEQVTPHSPHISRITGWLYDEWGGDRNEILRLMQSSDDRPSATVAYCDARPVGVITLKTHQENWQPKPALWINAVWVLPKYRRRGIARQLVLLATHSNPVTMFVYTDLPFMYTSCGWQVVRERDSKNHQTLVHPARADDN